MSFTIDIKAKRKILKVIYQNINKISTYYKKIVAMQIYDLTYRLSIDKGKRSEKHCNNQLLKYAMANNNTIQSTKKYRSKNKFKQKLFKKIGQY